MALASIQVEQFSAGRWTGSVEVGGMVARRKEVRASSFDEMLAALSAAYRGMVPAAPRPLAAQPDRAPEETARLVEAISRPVSAPAQRATRDELLERARQAGVEVDGRWSDARLLYQTTLAEEEARK